jgi:hypothetical protein
MNNKKLRNWIEETIIKSDWTSMPNIHIDEISLICKDISFWISEGIKSYKFTLEILENRPYNALLVIPLTTVNEAIDLDFASISEVNKHLDITPPSIYILPNYKDNFQRTLEGAVYLKVLGKVLGFNTYYKIDKGDEEEYDRSIFVIGTNELFVPLLRKGN